MKILLVDSHRVLADALAMRLRADPDVSGVDVAHSLHDARIITKEGKPDLVVLDVDLGDESGLDLLPTLDELAERPDVLVLSAVGDSRRMVGALEAGVQGWVSKASSTETLSLALDEVRNGHMYLSPNTVRPVLTRLLGGRRSDSFVDDLTRRQREVLRCLVSGMTRQEIATRLYLSVNTVRTHVQHLLQHSDQHSTLALVALARDAGVPGIDEAHLPRQRHPQR